MHVVGGSSIKRMCEFQRFVWVDSAYDRLVMHAFSLLASSHAHATLSSAPKVNRSKPPTLRQHPHVPFFSHHATSGVTWNRHARFHSCFRAAHMHTCSLYALFSNELTMRKTIRWIRPSSFSQNRIISGT